MADRATPEGLAAVLEPIVRERIPGAENAKVVNVRRTERGFSTETFLFDLEGVESGTHQSAGYVFRRPPEVSLFPDYDLRRQYLVADRLAPTALPVPTMRWIDENLQFNEILAAVQLSLPLLRLSTHLQLDGHTDLTAFCKAKLEQLLPE